MKKLILPGIIALVLFGTFAFINHNVKAQSINGNGLVISTGPNSKFWQRYTTDTAIGADPDATIRYNPAGETTNLAGAVNQTGYNEAITLIYRVPTLGSDGIDITVWGADTQDINRDLEWSLLYTESVDANGTSTTFLSVPIQERPFYIRTGYQSTGSDGTDAVDIIITGVGKSQ